VTFSCLWSSVEMDNDISGGNISDTNILGTNIYQVCFMRGTRRILVTRACVATGRAVSAFLRNSSNVEDVSVVTIADARADQEVYDMFIADPSDIADDVIPYIHMCRAVFVFSPAGRSVPHRLGPLAVPLGCVDGALFCNPFISLRLENPSVYESMYVRDQPWRLLKGAATVARLLNISHVLHVGAFPELAHPLDNVNPGCCSHGHVLAHWTSTLKAKVLAVLPDQESEQNLNVAFEEGHLKLKNRVELYIGEENLQDALHGSAAIGLLSISDADWLKEGNTLKTLVKAEDCMADENLVCLTDLKDDDHRDVVAHLEGRGYVKLISGRVGVFFKGDLRRLRFDIET
jgi:hypothetical protein